MNTQTDLGYPHRFVPATAPDKTPLLLLHGQGGSETDLLPVAEKVAPGAALLSPRGNTQAEGLTRFFGRLPNGDWDVPDFRRRTLELAAFVEKAQKAYGLGKLFVLGFSNGSNIGWSLLMARPDLIKGAVLLRSMLPFDPRPVPKLPGVPILQIAGDRDSVIPSDQPAPLLAMLKETGADLTHHRLSAGHRLTDQDMAIMQDWLAARI